MIYDVSRPVVTGMAVYKNKEMKQPHRRIDAVMEVNNIEESTLTINLHTGTHVDAPAHMIPGGKHIDEIDVSLYFGRAKLFDLNAVETYITLKDIEAFDIEEGDIVLFKTRNSLRDDFDPEFVYIEVDAAQHLVDKKIKTVGIDAMSIERGKPDHPTHSIILGAGLGVIEDLRLKDVPAGEYELMALPLRLQGYEGSPVRAILKTIDEESRQLMRNT